jgi:hypothetical protein
VQRTRRATGTGRELGRRRFDNLHIELSVALRVAVSRFDLWMELHECNIDPEHLTQEGAMAFCDGPLESYLHSCGLSLPPRELRRLSRKIERFDPTVATPYERFAALT